MVVVCAAAISFSALCAGFGDNFTRTQDELMNKISNREIWVVNATAPGHIEGENYSLPMDLAFTKNDLINFNKISEMDGVYPYFEFVSSQYTEGQTEDENRNITVTFEDASSKKVQFDFGNSFKIVPYFPDQLMDEKSEELDETAENGFYLSDSMAKLLKVDSPKGVALTADALVPVKLQKMQFQSADGKSIEGDMDVCVLNSISGKVRGILEEQIKNPYTQGTENIIYVPYTQMEALLNSQKRPELGENESEWMPSACVMNARNYQAVETAKEKLSHMNSSFLVYNRYQDFESMKASIQTIRDMTFIVSIVILIIIFLLMSVIYINYVEGRKFEFSILRANGVTKREIRKLVYLESLSQVIKTFLIALGFAAILTLVTNLLIFRSGMISYDLKLVATVAVVSLLSIILPAVITLKFVNKYEPDRVMRN